MEVNVGVLCRTAYFGILGCQSTCSKCIDCVHVDEFCQVVVFEHFDFLDFVGRTETVEEVNEGHAAFDCGQVSNTG